MLSEKAVKETPIANIRSISSTVWRMLLDLVISGTGEVLSDRAVKETPVTTTESAAFCFSNFVN